MMQDIGILTGGKYVMKDLGIELDAVAIADLGQAKKVTVDNDNTTIIEGAGDSKAIKARVEQIKREVEITTSDYDREKLQERLAKLAGGVAQINVGAATETELKEKKARIEDALHATRAAIEEGIVPGGGVALVRCMGALDKVDATGDEKIGVEVVRQALPSPLKQIAENAGREPGIVLAKVLSKSGPFGYNAETNTFGDLFRDGVIDPAKVVRVALENAGSVARILLTTDCIVTEKPKKKEKGGPGHGHGGMDEMGGMDDMM